jgi:ATP-dependent exoDNAse (exonuclease V) alpha subunit
MDKIQERAIYLALRGHNILITGFPGTGKSFTVIELAKQLKAVGKNVVVTATTGIAAQGLSQKLPEHYGTVSTIHKFVGLKDGRYENDELLNLIVNDENFVDIKDNINSMDTLIIDEILSRNFLVQIQNIFESVRCSACPFGGVQMILSGDFYQLPPVPDINYGDNGQMCYNSLYVKKFFHHVQLDMIHRQEEPDFISALHQIAG